MGKDEPKETPWATELLDLVMLYPIAREEGPEAWEENVWGNIVRLVAEAEQTRSSGRITKTTNE